MTDVIFIIIIVIHNNNEGVKIPRGTQAGGESGRRHMIRKSLEALDKLSQRRRAEGFISSRLISSGAVCLLTLTCGDREVAEVPGEIQALNHLWLFLLQRGACHASGFNRSKSSGE